MIPSTFIILVVGVLLANLARTPNVISMRTIKMITVIRTWLIKLLLSTSGSRAVESTRS